MLKGLFSMKAAVVMLVLFGVLVGVATFIENDYGTQSAKALIYQAKWFELFLFYFIGIVIYNIILFRSYRKKLPVFIFHLSFLIIGIGALMTRYIGFEGMMPIREGAVSSTMFSDTIVLQVYASNKGEESGISKPLWFSSLLPNRLNESFSVGDKKVEVKLLEYLPEADIKLIQDQGGKSFLELVVSMGQDGQTHYLSEGETKEIEGVWFAFEASLPQDTQGWIFHKNTDGIVFEAPWDVASMKMDDQSKGTLQKGISHRLDTRILYQSQFGSIVLKAYHSKAKLTRVSNSMKPSSAKPQWTLFEVQVGSDSTRVELPFVQGKSSPWKRLHIDGVDIALTLGSKAIELPFAIKLEKFKLERYPGSNTPSSYASDVLLVDIEENLTMPYEIYMNHVLDYKGYRFFQASYDPDEKGTILSVNHDPGVRMTYVGYFLLALGMIWALFTKNGRFQTLWRETKKLQNLAVFVLLAGGAFVSPAYSATPVIDLKIKEQISGYDKAHIANFSRLVVQDFQGRMKPIDTMAREVVSKISGKKTLFNLSPTEIFLGMMLKPDIYQEIPLVKIGHPQIAIDLGLHKDTKFAKFTDFFSEPKRHYKLFDAVAQANQKKPLEKSQYDKELILIDERVDVLYRTFMGSMLRIFPIPKDPNNTWLAPLDAIEALPLDDAKIAELTTSNYFNQVTQAIAANEWSKADEALGFLEKFQHLHGSAIIPSSTTINWEIQYNNWDIFSRLVPFYLLFGILILAVAFVDLFREKRIQKTFVFAFVLGIGLAIHFFGLGVRWYISGHSPWSNAYEAMVFIAASTVVAGLLLGRKSLFVIGATALLAGITMAVAHLSLMNPQITPLVPVLKSYWLIIHVALIISGDGFLGLGSILSLIVLILIGLSKQNSQRFITPIKELTNLSEMSLILGLVVFTIGNFLGGVWANESWGRYWGWDPKETWAAVTILIYAAVLHLRFVPRLRGVFVYNVAALWAYSTVLMTYFGVNYYLSGLHSYAAGDPVPIPSWVYVVVVLLGIVTFAAWLKKERFRQF